MAAPTHTASAACLMPPPWGLITSLTMGKTEAEGHSGHSLQRQASQRRGSASHSGVRLVSVSSGWETMRMAWEAGQPRTCLGRSTRPSVNSPKGLRRGAEG